MNATEYKIYHQKFMFNNHGSTAFHTFCCIMYTVQCCLFTSILRMDQRGKYLQYLYEYIIIILFLIAANTFLAHHIYLLNITIFLPLAYEIYGYWCYIDVTKKLEQPNDFKKIQTITTVRGLTYLMTVFCILAVDFQGFPRNLAKTENYGYSLMDTGVGLFVLISGLVHKDVRQKGIGYVLKSNAQFVSILFCLGVGRYVSVKQLDYHEHVTEYGVHWNFFFTIAVCKLLSSLLLYFSDKRLLLSIVTLAVHEFLLYYGLEGWVFSDIPRTDLISANREGIASSLGYVSMYLFAAYFQTVFNDKSSQRSEVLKKLMISVAILWTFTCILPDYRTTSRTLANAGYCLYIAAILWSIMMVTYFVEVIYDDFEAPMILSDINANGLPCFLVANLITGAINLSVRTLLVSTELTFLILNVYMVSLLTFMVLLKGLQRNKTKTD
ncbi:phosphatidylinositol-glycan biosynthesis class W protein-like [Plodia interpunctella]|uniref:phosphatidylinositol-glycan biosynthesis class W protein-like n=1 Tax=Plodia interpunctella TaxID=58824 RepID=UPI002368F091|nr:phosphatidylinositol-glycan biosynthesis class W protein-like [Plodia interpunctella]